MRENTLKPWNNNSCEVSEKNTQNMESLVYHCPPETHKQRNNYSSERLQFAKEVSLALLPPPPPIPEVVKVQAK